MSYKKLNLIIVLPNILGDYVDANMNLFIHYYFLYCMESNKKLYYNNPIQQPLFEEDDDGKLIFYEN
jgi:hypothetical protein